MKLLEKFWQNFKAQPDIWFFYGFLLTFTLSIRKVIYFFPINESFNEYTSTCLCLSDIFLFLTIASWLWSALRNKQRILSSSTTLLPAILVLWAFISIIWSENHWLAIFRSIKILEFFLLFIFIIYNIKNVSRLPAGKMFRACPPEKCFAPARRKNVSRGTFLGGWNNPGRVEHFWEGGTFLRNSFLTISILGLFQSIIGITQVFLQRSVGLFWLKESLISPEIPGVAKIILNGERFIRAYGLFPHPNILGGFLVFSIILTIYLIKNVPRGTLINNFLKNSLGIEIIGLLLTFSKSAILGLIIALAYLFYKKILHMFHVEHLKRKLLITLTLLALIVVIAKPNFYAFFQKSLGERTLYLKVSRGTIITNPLAGIGNGQFVLEMRNYIPQKLETWQFQPVHNVFLLILSELGLVGLVLFIWLLWKLLTKNVSRLPAREMFHVEHPWEGGTFYFKSIPLAFIFIMLFDHYLWDIQQGQILLWLTFGLIAGDNATDIDKS